MLKNIIIFNNNYPKINNQKKAQLVCVIQEIEGQLLHEKFPDLVAYDVARDDGKYFCLNPNKKYMLLLFVGEKGILFSTFRTQNETNQQLYADSIGKIFEVVIVEEK